MIVALIPAKSDSTRLPGKNMLDLLGSPYSIMPLNVQRNQN